VNQALDTVRSLILGLFHVIMAGIAVIEGFLAGLLTWAGITGDPQKGLLTAMLVVLILVAFRLFGRVFGVLIAIFLALLLLQALVPGFSTLGAHAIG
jgi:hypothetical protein